jgi:hypothetical protein
MAASLLHAVLVPLQVSSGSQGPTLARQTVPAAMTTSTGQLLLRPSQVSAASQSPAAARHGAPAIA